MDSEGAEFCGPPTGDVRPAAFGVMDQCCDAKAAQPEQSKGRLDGHLAFSRRCLASSPTLSRNTGRLEITWERAVLHKGWQADLVPAGAGREMVAGATSRHGLW